ncbi:MAG: DUF1554 domain-containing protein [Deltaproteobacteria bacterium]|nr:DUF1554 domain-containing protein [Deltaproteobacteria bacterium]
MRFGVVVVAVAACHSSAHHAADAPPISGDVAVSDGAVDAWTSGYVPHESRALGLNDIAMLFQLPEDFITGTTIARMTGVPGFTGELVPRDAFAHLVTTPGDIGFAYESFHLVALRVDLCDRTSPGACPYGADGQLRLVFQPIISGTVTPSQAADVALHAFYPIPAADLGPLVDELRALARLRNFETASPLAVDDAVASTSPPTPYRTRLRALIARYAVAGNLQRLTLFGQDANQPADTWVFRGVNIVSGVAQDLTIPTLSVTQQRVKLVESPAPPSYQTTPIADVPAGIQLLVDGPMYSASVTSKRIDALAVLGPMQNPTLQAFGSQQCINCHVSTFLTQERCHLENIDPSTLPYRYTSSRDLAINFGVSATSEGSLRAFGWLNWFPAISQRVANEAAQTLDEIEARYPPAQTTTYLDAGVPDAAPTYKRVFVAAAQHDGNFGGLAGADAICTAAANAAHLGGGPWVAWLSTSTTNAIARLTSDGPWNLVDGTPVFATKAAIPMHPANAIDLDAHGGQPSGAENIWTGTLEDGTVSAYTCNDWTSNSSNATGSTGMRVAVDATWTAASNYNVTCNDALLRLYCFEQ